MPERTVILSDLHLGRPHASARSVDALRPLWVGASRLIVNGDAAETHHPDYREAADRELMRLIDGCERDGVELTLIAGNHDPSISGVRHLALCGASVLVTHGDVLHPAIAPWSPAAGDMWRSYRIAMRRLRHAIDDRLARKLVAAGRASVEEWSMRGDRAAYRPARSILRAPWTAASVLAYWRRAPRLAARLAARHLPSARLIVIGHTHRRGVWEIDGRTVLNTGCFGFPSRPGAVVIDGRRLRLVGIERAAGRYRLSDAALYETELPRPIEWARRSDRTGEARPTESPWRDPARSHA